jgi:peptidoglycan/xylan/chitin deacetylase (PgdA/CDA1 family)
VSVAVNGDTTPALERGVFTISLDCELIWGTLDLFGPNRFRSACLREREIIDRLLSLFVEYDVRATWCIVGHLFLDRCTAGAGIKHPEIVRPQHAWHLEDWFSHDPCGTETTAPTFYGKDLVNKVRRCPVPQEIGCHTFSHVIFGDPGCSAATAASELEACVHLAEELGLRLESFAFPRNRVGHLALLPRFGFRCYRGPDAVWYEQAADRWPSLVRRLAHLWDVLRAARPPVVLPVRMSCGVWNIAGSMIYFPRHGWRRMVPDHCRIRRAIKGLEAAAEQRKIFHLWFHPTNLADGTEPMLAGLRSILAAAAALRGQGRLDIKPMYAVVPESDAAGRGVALSANR